MGGRNLVYFAPYWIGVDALRMFGRQIPRTLIQGAAGILSNQENEIKQATRKIL